MARIRWRLPIAGGALLALMITAVAADAPADKAAPQPSAEDMAAMMAAMAPGPQHKQLEMMVGSVFNRVMKPPAATAPAPMWRTYAR